MRPTVDLSREASGGSDGFFLREAGKDCCVQYMCGRFTQSKQGKFPGYEFEPFMETRVEPNFNIAPSQFADVFAIMNGKAQISKMHFGFIPHWAKDRKIAFNMINARSETVHEKPAFRDAFSSRRCLVLADGYYEWKEPKRPYRIIFKDEEPFLMAGIWSSWQEPDGERVHSFSLLTTVPNAVAGEIHDRMPVILEREHHERWLDPEFRDAEKLRPLLRACSGENMEAYPVDPRIGSPKFNTPECLERYEDEPLQGELF